MVPLILFAVTAYFLISFNITCLRYLIDSGKFKHPFWTRSLRSVFLVPPFAILIICYMALKESLSDLGKNIKFITTKRKD